jgi:hypothetical protein
MAIAVIFAGAIVQSEGTAAAANPQAATLGQWSTPGDLCPPDHACTVGGAAAVLPGGTFPAGTVLFFFWKGFNTGGKNSMAVLLQPNSGIVTDVTLPFPVEMFCSGLSIMPNGQLLTTGGEESDSVTPIAGPYWTTIYNPFSPLSSAWSWGPDMNYPRYYPTTIEMGDGTQLEFSGDDRNGDPVPVLESYNYITNKWRVLPPSADMPTVTLHVSAYPRLVLLPSGNVFLAAPDRNTYQFNPSTNTWSFVGTIKDPYYRYASGHVLLPGLQKVLVAGGAAANGPGGGPTTNTAEVIDFSVPKPVWSYTGSMTYARLNNNLVLLADGTVLVVGGAGGMGIYSHPVMATELYNPATGTWKVMAPLGAPRMYHSTAFLLPNGQVLSAGSSDTSSTQYTYELYSPPYLFAGPQPVITRSPANVHYGKTFSITTPNAASITRVALIKLATTTHADNMDQRYVDLSFTIGSGQLTAVGPPSGNYAPPGPYMLVILNSSGVPSVMPFVVLG